MPVRPDWQTQLSTGFSDPADLLRFLGLDVPRLPAESSPFPFRVTKAFAQRMERGNPDDPLLLQVLPDPKESLESEHFLNDPVGDLASSLLPGLIQKYAARVLLVTTGACAIHCRYCFRRNFPYERHHLSKSRISECFAQIQADPKIHEVILSGGDPLVLSNERLEEVFKIFGSPDQIDTIRIHSRLPVVLPDRIDQGFIRALRECPAKMVAVIHCNHPNEIDAAVEKALARLSEAGVTLLNQSVLLKGVNDNAETLISLSRRLFQSGVLPYYLHELDRAKGTAHFEVAAERSASLLKALQENLPGYLVPRLVREVPGGAFKMPSSGGGMTLPAHSTQP